MGITNFKYASTTAAVESGFSYLGQARVWFIQKFLTTFYEMKNKPMIFLIYEL